MAFLESPRFPDKYALNATGGPEFDNDVVIVNSGDEFRQQNWSQARLRFDVSQAPKLATDFDDFIAFFRIVKGRLIAFRFKDWTDYTVAVPTVTGSPLEAEGVLTSITGTTWQLWKRYTSGSSTSDRKITKPVSNKVTVVGGTVTGIDYGTGIVTTSSGTPTYWSGEFDVPCRFDVDRMEYDIVDRSQQKLVLHWHSIPIIEVRDIA